MFKAYIKAILDLVKRAAFPSNTLVNLSYTDGDVGDWGTFFSYTPTADGYFRIGAESKDSDSVLQIYSGNYAQTLGFDWVGEGMSLTVPCTKGQSINCIGGLNKCVRIGFGWKLWNGVKSERYSAQYWAYFNPFK